MNRVLISPELVEIMNRLVKDNSVGNPDPAIKDAEHQAARIVQTYMKQNMGYTSTHIPDPNQIRVISRLFQVSYEHLKMGGSQDGSRTSSNV